MIDFACKTFEIQEIVRCSLGLTKSDLKIINYLIKNKSFMSSKSISKELGLELSTVQRSLKKLHEKKIIIRSQTNFSKGGYLFNYKINNKTEIRKMIKNIIKEWFERAEKELDKW